MIMYLLFISDESKKTASVSNSLQLFFDNVGVAINHPVMLELKKVVIYLTGSIISYLSNVTY